ncbi:MAG: CHAT domain-containing protein [Bacteroidales bacterium]|nr:CHAT domain-containing protein [Bacteroidales bacterium]
MSLYRFFRACWVALLFCLALQAHAQPLDTLALRAKADSLNQAGAEHYANGDPVAAVAAFQEAIQIRETLLQERNAALVSSYNGLGVNLLFMGDYESAIVPISRAKDLAREFLGEQHPLYANCLNNIGLCYLRFCDYNKALDYITQAAEIRRALGEQTLEYTASLVNFGNCYHELGDYNKAIAYFTEAADRYRNTVGELSQQFAGTTNNIGNAYFDEGEYAKAIEYLTRALDIYEQLVGVEHPFYGNAVNNLGRCYSDLGDYVKSSEYFAKATEIYRNAFGEQSPYYALGLGNLGNTYFEMGEYDKAIAYFNDALAIYRATVGEDNMYCAGFYSGLGITYTLLGDFAQSYPYYQQALDITREIVGEKHPDYARYLNNLGTYYHNVGDDAKAIPCFQEALNVYREQFGDRYQDNITSLFYLGSAYAAQGDRDASSSFYRDYLSLVSGTVLEAFTYLSQNQRSLFWDKYKKDFAKEIAQQTRILSDDKPFLCASYDAALFSKGLLLNAETEMRRLILESGDEAALSLYDRLHMERLQLDRILELPIAERQMPADSLARVCETLEQELQQKSKAFGDYTRNLSINWKDVQSALGKNDIAIEFLEVPVSEDTTVYCALTVKPGYDAPHFVELFDLKDLKALKAKYEGRKNPNGLIYSDKELYNLVWKPLASELRGVRDIYFGPSGELYQTAIEYADQGKGPFNNQKNLYRLSSTRQLVVDRGEAERSRSAVFGGLKYGASEEVLLADSRKYAQRSISDDLFFSVDSLDIRGAGGSLMVADLPGTESEAREIDAMLRQSGLDNTLRMGEEGTEASFKDLSGRRENIIHIATHGFYWNGRQARSIGERLGRIVEDGGVHEDVSMTRSGLLFAGANNTLRGREKQEGVEDGILTAKEIAHLDLRGTDLLVLSACQTGLGEVSGEGVFGLQRGFKKAGVNTILMSLWEVDDDATRLLMTSFYKQLAKGLSKTDALKAAQKAVKNYKGKDFSSPYYWAAFILLDGK